MRHGWRMLGFLLAGIAGAGPTQARDDWDYGEDPARDLAIAAVTYENFGVAVRCMGDNLSVVMSGLPEGSGERTLRLALGDEVGAESAWVSARNSTTVFAVWPRAVATRLSAGGQLVLAVPDGEQTRRYAVDLPASATSVERVFRACGKTLLPADGRSVPAAEDFQGVKWLRVPEVRFPDRAQYENGLAAIRCRVEAGGGLSDCEIESEFPEGSGFGRAATLGAHRTARVAPRDPADADIAGRSVAFVVRYRMSGSMLTPPPSRLPQRD